MGDWTSAIGALKEAREKHTDGDDAGALSMAEKSLQICPSEEAQELVDHIRKFGDASELAAAARRVVEAKDLYDVLQLVPVDVTPEDVKRAYYKASKMVHPDKNKSRLSDDAFKRVGEAYHTLSDPGQKQVYDLNLEAICPHCAEGTTRGAMEAHLRACPQRPTTCAGCVADCVWSGVAGEQAAHEAICPRAICVRMMGPLQARCDRLQAENKELYERSRILKERNEEVQRQVAMQNEQLQRQAADLQQLLGRVRELEDGAEALSPRRKQRAPVANGGGRGRGGGGGGGRAGSAPAQQHDVPPSSEAVQQMEMAAAVAVLHAHFAAELVAAACRRIRILVVLEGFRQLAAETGAIEAVVHAMQQHPQVVLVHAQGCMALSYICMVCNDGAAGLARLERAAEAGALEAVVHGMNAHLQVADVQENACFALSCICYGTDAAGLARLERAAGAGALEAVVYGMQAHPQVATVQKQANAALNNMCWGKDIAGWSRKLRAVRAGARGRVLEAVQQTVQEKLVKYFTSYAVTDIGEIGCTITECVKAMRPHGVTEVQVRFAVGALVNEGRFYRTTIDGEHYKAAAAA